MENFWSYIFDILKGASENVDFQGISAILSMLYEG